MGIFEAGRCEGNPAEFSDFQTETFSSTSLWKDRLWNVKILSKTSGIKHSTKITEKLKVKIVECGILDFSTKTPSTGGGGEGINEENENGFQHLQTIPIEGSLHCELAAIEPVQIPAPRRAVASGK